MFENFGNLLLVPWRQSFRNEPCSPGATGGKGRRAVAVFVVVAFGTQLPSSPSPKAGKFLPTPRRVGKLQFWIVPWDWGVHFRWNLGRLQWLAGVGASPFVSAGGSGVPWERNFILFLMMLSI